MGADRHPDLIKHSWENTFDQIRSSARSAWIPDYRHGRSRGEGDDFGPVYRAEIVSALRQRPPTRERQTDARAAPRVLGVAAVHPGTGVAQIPLQRLRAHVLAAFSRHPAAQTGHRALPPG